MNNNIYAYTEFTYKDYPAYISLNERDGSYTMTVRSKDSGVASEITISDGELLIMADKIMQYFGD